MMESISAVTDQQCRKGGGEYSPHSINTSHWFNCGLSATSKFAPKMPNIYSTITLVNGNFYAASGQQWRKGGGCKFSPSASLIFVLFQFVTYRQQQRSLKNYLKCNSATALMNENLYATSEEQWRKNGRGANSPPESMKNVHFTSCDFPSASTFSHILHEMWRRNWFD